MWKEKYIKYLRYEKNCSSHTEIAYFKDLSQFQEFVENETGTFDIESVDADLIRVWVSTLMENGLKETSVNRKLSSVKSFYVYLQRKGVVDVNPTSYVSGPKVSSRLPDFVKHSDMIKVLSPLSYSDDFEGVRNHFLMELFYATGMRREELIMLKDENVDISSCTLRVHGKGNKERLIPFSEKTKKHLLKYIDVRNTEIENRTPFLFVRKNGMKMCSTMVYTIVNKHLSSVKTISRKSPHVLRHSFATAMMDNGADINAVKNILGHASLSSTQLYTHVTFKELKKVYDNAHPRA